MFPLKICTFQLSLVLLTAIDITINIQKTHLCFYLLLKLLKILKKIEISGWLRNWHFSPHAIVQNVFIAKSIDLQLFTKVINCSLIYSYC